jgi:hypothetical protein
MEAAIQDNPSVTVAPRILNHDIMDCTADGVNGNFLYSSRALGMSEPDDIIQLHPDLRFQWPSIREHYRRIGLAHTHRVIWNVDLDHLGRHSERAPSVFFFGPREHAARPDDDWLEVVETINSKNSFVQLADRLGVPIPRTLCFEQPTEVFDADLGSLPFPCYIKAAVSVSGVGIYRCADSGELLEAVGRFELDVPVQVQEEIDADCFLNMQYRIVEGHARRLLTTEQILDGCAHQGNLYPARREPWETVEPLASWMADKGFKDVLAFDVAVVEREGGADYYAIECNPRFNGASYPSAIAAKLGLSHWQARNVTTRHRSLAAVDLSGIEYNPVSGKGVVLVNWGPILVGKLMVLLAGPPKVQERLALELARRL